MSPALLEVRAPAKAAAPNPRDQGQIFTPLSDQIPIFSNRRGENQNPNPIEAMDQPNPYQFPPFSSYAKPSVSKPRLYKQRKNAAQRKSSAAAQEPAPSSSFNPFQAEKIEEEMNRWNPFVPESGARVSESLSENGAAFVGGGTSFDARGSVFGMVGGPKLSRNLSGLSVGSLDSAKSEGVPFVFSSGVKKNDDPGRSSSVGTDEGLASVLDKLPVEMEKMDLKNLGDGEKGFASGASSVNRCSENAEFPLRTGVKKSVDLSRNSSFNSVEGPFSNIHDEMGKLNLHNTSNVDDLGKNKQSEKAFAYGASKNASVLSSGSHLESARFAYVPGSVSGSKPKNVGLEEPVVGSVSFGSKKSGNADVVDHIFRSGEKISVNLNQESSVGSDEGLFSNLPERVQQMNLNNGDDFLKANKAGVGFAGGNKSAPGSFDSDNGNEKEVPQETGKLNLGRESATMKNGSAASAAGLFVFGSSEMASASYGGSTVNSVNDDMEKLKIGTNTENLSGKVPFQFNSQTGKEDQRSNMGSVPSFPATGFQAPGFMSSSTGKPAGLGSPHMEFNTPKQDAARLTKESLFTGTYQNTTFSAKKVDTKGTKMKKKKGKSRQSVPLYQSFSAQFSSEGSGPEVNPEVDSGDYSPMDYSPYHEDIVADQYLREPSASEDSTRFVSCAASTDPQSSASGDEREDLLVSAAQRMNIADSNVCQEVGNEASEDNDKRSSNARSSSVDEQSNKSGNGSDISEHENAGLDKDSTSAPMEAEAGLFGSNVERPASEVRTEFTFPSGLAGLGESSFAFTASPFVGGPSTAAKHSHRRKNKLKSGQNPSNSTLNARVPLTSALPDLIPHTSTFGLPDSVEGQQNSSFVPQTENEIKMGKTKEADTRQEFMSSAAASAEQEACEKWRFRGNQAYANGHLTKAEEYYTRGLNSVSVKEIPSGCIRPLTLCYSNRAATRMSLGKMREALEDCMMAISIDPNFLKAQVRVANCHLALGEVGEALKHFNKCLQAEKDISSDRKYLIEASDGLQKAQQVADLTGQSAELLLRRTSSDASKALNMICEALSISPHSESLLEMKAEALLMMRKYEDVVKLCEQTLDLAEQNSARTKADSQFMTCDSSENVRSSSARLWRWRLIAKSYFYLGRLEEALELLQKHEKVKPAIDESSESFTSFAVTLRELLRLKLAGNEAFQAGRHSDAVEYYSSALACNAESRPFTAVCFCNRAAAYQALGQITDAIADCSLAIALDPNYAKAISRRATLHELIRDYGQAVSDLNRLIALLEEQTEERDNQSSGVARSTANGADLKRARTRLATVEEEARRGISLNMYMILGIEPSSSAADVKKAYRKAALRHHPDKAGQCLVRSENVDDGLWREVAANVHSDADRLFKMIGEAYTILSDHAKRLQYDAEEEMRTCPVKSYSSNSPKTPSDNYGSHYEKSFNRRQWRSYGNSYQRW